MTPRGSQGAAHIAGYFLGGGMFGLLVDIFDVDPGHVMQTAVLWFAIAILLHLVWWSSRHGWF